MPEAPQDDAPGPAAGALAAWRSSSDLRFYATALVAAADLVLVVSLVRAREEPEAGASRPRPTAVVYERASPRDTALAEPSSPDPLAAPLDLAAALAGIPGAGAPAVTIETTRGTLRCELWADRAPRGVALFVGLARGLRPHWDPAAGRWSREPFYDGSVVFRAVSGALIEGGGPTRAGGAAPGFEVPMELGAPHDRAGLLSLTPRGTLQVTAAPRPDLDGADTIIGRCDPVALVDLMTDVRVQGDRPAIPIFIRAVRVARGT